ncbi:MAG: microviridin/marinostatin family tricyclic proteinase inhibitor [Stigonema ocellatum SAG 48.90 = DSM 106950]|nr:microviridin/marinostatin family tricyclic proteinase inhibitor [Stigonema ocellatum SAG 48.90 = DSM 106950]
MSESKTKDSNSQAVPFFARFLEEQNFVEEISDEESEAANGGHKVATRKYPSDAEDVAVTLKYPSDGDDVVVTTLKYPSDGEDVAVTQKYPSDSDEHATVDF